MCPTPARLAVCAALVASCGAELELPPGVVILCALDADCPDGRVCTALGTCVGERDDVAPEVLSAAATSPATIVVAVSEQLIAPQPDAIAITTAFAGESLTVTRVTPSGDGLTLTISTLTQLPGVGYTVDLSAATDAQGNAMADTRSTAFFRGFGGAPDDSPPQTLLPPDASRVIAGVEHRPVDLVWTARSGASAYTVEIATTSDFAQPVTTFETGRDQTSARFTPSAPVTYYWRVRADTTTTAAFGVGEFSVIEDALHVYCAMGADCSGGAGREVGDRTFPFRSVARAITSARADGIATIAVAGRGAASYTDIVAPPGGMTLRGGFDASFDSATRSVAANPTSVRAVGTVLVIGAVTSPVTIDGMHFIADLAPGVPAGAQQLTSASVNGATASVTFSACRLETAAGPDKATGLAVTTAGSGTVHLTQASSVVVGAPLSSSTGVIVNVGSSATLDAGSSVDVAPPSGDSDDEACIGVAVTNDGRFTARNAVMRAGPRTLSAVVFAAGGEVDVEDSILEIPAGNHGPLIWSFPFGPTTLRVRNNRLSCPECAAPSIAVFLTDPGGLLDAELVNNLILVDGSVPTGLALIHMTGLPRVALVHNTVVSGAPSTAMVQIAGSPVVTNNLFVCGNGGTGINEQSSAFITDPASFEGNTLVGCGSPYRNESDAAILTTGAAINALNGGEIAAATCSGCQHSRYGANVVSGITPSAFFTSGVGSDGHLDVAAAFVPSVSASADAGGGKSTSGTDCGALEAPVACGDVDDDFAGATRGAPPTRGAVEAP